MPPSPTITPQQVRQALKKWHRPADLGQTALAQIPLVTAVCAQQQYDPTPAGRGLALRHLLREQIKALAPSQPPEPDYNNRQWRLSLMMQAQFIEQRAAQDIREELGISESGYFKDQRHALNLIAQRLQAAIAQTASEPANQQTSPPTHQPSPPPPPAPLNLPHPPTPFIGREKERAQIAELLTNPAGRLVTLFGTGGMGKTRLAIQAAQDYHEKTGHSAYFVPLETVDTADLLVPLIAQAVQLSFDTQGDPLQQLRNFLRGRPLLLLLDNMEHLLPNALDLVQEMLTHLPEVRLLVTSRERLNLRGEWVLSLSGLDVPPTAVQDVTALAEYSGVQLFVEALHRGQLLGNRLDSVDDLDGGELTAVAQICRLVGGQPLALELAASWGNLLSCADIATEIQNSLDFLAGTYHDLPARHQSLRAVFEHSWRLLTPAQQGTFRQLAVFRGSFSREAAAEVMGVNTGVMLATLHALASKSLLRVTGEKRFVVHPLLRQFAAEQLHAVPAEQTAVQKAHCRYFLTWVAAHTVGLKQGNRQTETIAAFRAELENIRLAWQVGITEQAWDCLLKAAVGLSYFYHSTNRFQEGLELLASTAVSLTQTISTPQTEQLRGLLLGLQARMHHILGQREAAQSAFQRSLTLLSDSSFAPEMAEQRALIQLFAIEADLPAEANPAWQPRALYEACLAHFGATGEAWGTAYAHVKYVSYLRLSGFAPNVEYQRGLLQESLQLREQIGDQRGVASTLSLLGDLAYERGDYDEARQYAAQSLRLYDALGNNLGRALALNHLGQVAGSKGDYHAAKRYYEESLALLRVHGNPREMAVCLDCVGYITYLLADLDTAVQYYQESLELSQEMGDAAGTAWSWHNLGDIARARQDFGTARELYQRSYDLHITVDELSWGGAVALDKLGRVRLELGDLAGAEADFRLALSIAHQTERFREMLDALLNLARLAWQRGERDTAVSWLSLIINHPAAAQEAVDTAVALLNGRPPLPTPPLADVVRGILSAPAA